MTLIKSSAIYDTVKRLCFIANTKLPKYEYDKLYNFYRQETNTNAKEALKQIILNAQIASEEQRPLCQDTGLVTVFLEIGQNVRISGKNINEAINDAVADAYKEYFFRKSIVQTYPDRINTNDNTPVIIHTDIVRGDDINIWLVPKGGGCENVSNFKMFAPGTEFEKISDFVVETVKNASSKPCPPIKVGIGIGGNFEYSAILSKKALLMENSIPELKKTENNILEKINKLKVGVMGLGGSSTCFDVKILHSPCHIASLPVSVSISCHSSRHAEATLTAEKVEFLSEEYKFYDIEEKENNNIQEINVSETEKIRELKAGTPILLSGKIYTARDAAHKKFDELIKEGKNLPIEIQNSIIFYAGPCPPANDEIIGPVGPTTSARMDIFTPQLYERGLLATIGKGERSEKVKNTITMCNGKYFTVTGGVASLLKKCVKNAKLIAYPELGTEAVYELEIEKLPLIVKI